MRSLRVFFFLGLSFLFLGAVLKKKDGIQMTQTDPVNYQEKMKEEEGGKKGPPSPSLRFFPKERFMSEGPVEKKEKQEPPSEEIQPDQTPEELKPENETDDTSEASEEVWDLGDTDAGTKPSLS